MERKVSDPDASSSSSKPDAAASSSKAPSVNLVVYSRKRKESHPDASSSKAPSVDMVVYSRKRKKGQPNRASSSKPDAAALSSKAPSVNLVVYSRKRQRGDTSLVLWDLQLHTTIADVLKTFKDIARPRVVHFISLNDCATSYTWCCRLDMGSERDTNLILATSPCVIKGINVKVTKLEEFRFERGAYKLKIRGMNDTFTYGVKAFCFFRDLFEHCGCCDIELIKVEGLLEKLDGTAKMRFRTLEGKTDAELLVQAAMFLYKTEWIVT